MDNVVSLKQYQYENQYAQFYNGTAAKQFDLAMDTVPVSAKKSRDIRKEMILGYLKLLSNN